MDETPLAAPADVRPLLDELFHRIEQATGWRLTEARSATVEIVRDGAGFTLFLKGRYAERDLKRSDTWDKDAS